MKKPITINPIIGAVVAAVACAAFPAAAQQYESSLGQTYKNAYLQNSMWPSQYIGAARCAMKRPFDAMISNGWRRQNLIGPQHFTPGTSQLTESGQLKAEWILTQAPVDHRNVFVQQAADQEETNQRIQALHEYAATIDVNSAPGNISATTIRDRGRPASIVDQAFIGFAQNQPLPVLPAASGGEGN